MENIYENAKSELEAIIRQEFPNPEVQMRTIQSSIFELAVQLKVSGFPVTFLVAPTNPDNPILDQILNGAWLRIENLSFSQEITLFVLLKDFYSNHQLQYDAQLSLIHDEGELILQNTGRNYLTKLRGEDALQALKLYNSEFENFLEYLKGRN